MHDDATHSTRESDNEDWGGHPLFPRPETATGRDPRKFDRIQLIRYHPNGSREVAPKTWKGGELHSWQQILDEYGGGCTYQLVAQCGKTHKYSAWSEKWFFADPPQKPLRNDHAGCAAQKDPPQVQGQPIPQTTMSTEEVLLQMHLMFMKWVLEQQAAPQPNLIEMVQALASMMNRGPTQFEMFKEMLPFINGGGKTNNSFLQGIELARELYENAPAPVAEPARSSSDDIGDLANLVKLFTAVRPANPSPPAPPTPPPPPKQSTQNAFAPPCAPPPGYGWMYTQQGWVAFPITMTTNAPSANRVAPAPPPAAPPVIPASQFIDEDALLRKLIDRPETRAKIQSMLAGPSHAPAPVPPPVPPAPPAVTPVVKHVSAPPAPITPAVMPIAQPSQPPVPAPAAVVSPAKPPQENTNTIPDDVPIDDELRAMLAEPEFQKLALSIVGAESHDAFTRLVRNNAKHLQEMPRA